MKIAMNIGRGLCCLLVLILVGGSRSLPAQVSKIPSSVSKEMRAEKPEVTAVVHFTPNLAAAILHYVKADLWVVTRIHMVAPDVWNFTSPDIKQISRRVNGEMIVIYKQDGERT